MTLLGLLMLLLASGIKPVLLLLSTPLPRKQTCPQGCVSGIDHPTIPIKYLLEPSHPIGPGPL